MAHEVTVYELAERIRKGTPVQLVDVREDWEREIAVIPGSLHIPMNSVPERLAELKAPEGGEIVIYCHGGVRSLRVASWLEKHGIPGVGSLAGGIDSWSALVDPRVPRY